MKSTNNISGLLKRQLLFLTPMFLAIATYAYLDPFKVVLHYDSVYAHNYTGGVGLNAGYVSTATFDNNCKHIAYNSFIFGNSRSIYYRVYEWQKYLSHGCMPYHFDASAETIDGIARKMAYIQSKGLRIHNALLIIDASVVSRTTPLDGHLYALPPQLCAYRNFLKFHTDFLCAFLNPKFLCAFTDYSINGKIKDYMKHDYLLSDEHFTYSPTTNECCYDFYEQQIASGTYYTPERMKVFDGVQHPDSISPKVIGTKQLAVLKHISQILHTQATNYKIVISPLYNQIKFNPADLAILHRMFGKENVYDFSGKNRFTNDYHNYYEQSHYRPTVASDILHIIYPETEIAGNGKN